MKKQILKYLIEKDDFISGEELSNIFNVSRTAIWKHINNLKKEGYLIESVNKKGYKLLNRPDILDENIIKEDLKAKYFGKKIYHFESLDSTNNYIKNNYLKLNDKDIIIAEEQIKGRGRTNRYWHSKKGEGIWMSIYLKPDILPFKAPIITQLTGASIIKALDNLGIKTSIKWPNDIFLNDKKLCGILTEMKLEVSDLEYIIVGIGMNVNSIDFDDEIKDIATSIKAEGFDISRVDIIREILKEFEVFYLDYIKNEDKKFMDICRKRSNVLGNDIFIIKNNERIKAKAIDLNNDGNLIVLNEDNKEEELFSGEVSIRKDDK
ncbi:biotin--[acetyl-CoA-carboxylase] ligase [Peptostreptococcaceae bacterium AGR-M142]